MSAFEARIKLSQTITDLWATDESLKKIRQAMMAVGEKLHEYYKKCLKGEPVEIGGKRIEYKNAAECLEKVAETLGIDKQYFKIWRGGA